MDSNATVTRSSPATARRVRADAWRRVPVLLALLVGPAAAVAACDDSPAASLDAADSGEVRETSTSDDATSLPDGDPRLDAGADSDSEAGRCPFTTPAAAALPVTTCTAKFGNGVDRLLSIPVTVDGQGNIIFAGVLYGTVDFGGGPLTSAGGQDIFIVKLNSSCQHVWSKRFGDANGQGARSLATNAVGEIYLASEFTGAGTVDFGTGPLTASDVDFAVTKFDACGNVLWAKKFGTTGVARLGGLNLDSQSNILLGGGFYGSLDFGGGVKTGIFPYGQDIFLAKLDRDGKHVWSKVFTRPGDDTGTGVAGAFAFAPDGTIYAAGTGNGNPAGGGTVDFGAGPVTFDGPLAGWITRFTPSGTALSTSKFEQATTPLAATSTGRLIAVGSLREVTDLGTGSLTASGPAGPTHPTSYVAEFRPDGSGATSVRAFGTANPSRTPQFRGFAVTSNAIGVSGFCAPTIDLGSGTACGSNNSVFLRYGLDGAFISLMAHPYGSVAATPTNQFVMAGNEGDTPGAPEKVTVTKFAP